MSFSTYLYTYGSPVVAVLACVLNLPEIILLVRRYRHTSKLRYERNVVPIILLASLALSDFLVGLNVILVKVVYYLMEYNVIPMNYHTFVLYKVLTFLFLRLSLLLSVLSLLAMTVDRLLAVKNPIKYRAKIRTRHGFIAVAVTWVSSSTIIAIHYYVSVYGDGSSFEKRMLIFPITIIPSSIAFALCYVKILREVFVQGREMKRVSEKRAGQRCPRYILEREFKVSRFAATVVCVFMVCWLPLALTGLIAILGVKIDPSLPNTMFLLSFLNSALNPLIYFAFKERLGRRFHLLASFFRRKRRGFQLRVRSERAHTKSTIIFKTSLPVVAMSVSPI